MNVGQSFLMLGDMLPVSAGPSSLEVVIEVVDLDGQGDLVAGLAYVPDVVHVRSLLGVGKQTQGVHYPDWEALVQKVFKTPVCILYSQQISIQISPISNAQW